MKVLSIGTDRKLFEQVSAVTQRNLAYAAHFEEVHIIIFSLKKDGLSPIKIGNNLFLHPTNSSSRWFFVRDAIRLGKQIIVDNNFVRGESVITCQDPFECGFVGSRIAKRFRLPLHIQVHTDFFSPYFKTSLLQRIRVMTAKHVLPKASGVRVVSQRIVDSLTAHQVHLKHPPVVLPIRVATAVPVVAPENDVHKLFPQFKFIVLMASRLSPEKRIRDGIDVFSEVLQSYPFAGLIIAGEGPEKSSLERHARDAGIADKVCFLGWLPDLSQVMKSADVFLLTSEYEGYGMTLIQAGIAGCPIVTTDVGVAGSVLKDGETAVVCAVGDVHCLAGGIIRMIHDASIGLKLKQNLRNEVEKSIPSEQAYIEAYVKNLEESILSA